MKLFLKKFFSSKLAVFFRNNLNIKPIYYSLKNINNSSVSDAFIWRTDNNFRTTIKFIDILKNYFHQKETYVDIYFYDRNNIFLKKIEISNTTRLNEIHIDKDFFNGKEDIGVFYIFHRLKIKNKINSILSNRCYVGYSQNNNLYSFVHGNTFARYKDINNGNKIKSNIISTTFLKNQSYKIQKYFAGFDKTELIFTNPTSKTIYFKIDNNLFKLNDGCSINVNVKDKAIINIKSNCFFLRPLVFSYKNNFLDVHHS